MSDSTSGSFTTFTVTAKYGTPGRSAEWIMERPTVGGSLNWLPIFGSLTFTGGIACPSTGLCSTSNSSGSFQVDMVNPGTGHTLAKSMAFGEDSRLIQWMNFS